MAENKQVYVGCKLPNGLIAQVGNTKVLFKGANSSRVVGGYGLTPVDKDFSDAWFKQHKNFHPVKAELIFVQGDVVSAEAQADEQSEVKSGLEGVDPAKPAANVEKRTED
jgi:hypothetical protein